MRRKLHVPAKRAPHECCARLDLTSYTSSPPGSSRFICIFWTIIEHNIKDYNVILLISLSDAISLCLPLHDLDSIHVGECW